MEKVKGQCESCGKNYELEAVVDGNQEIKCPHCNEVSENWDTPNSPQMAPSIVEIATK